MMAADTGGGVAELLGDGISADWELRAASLTYDYARVALLFPGEVMVPTVPVHTDQEVCLRSVNEPAISSIDVYLRPLSPPSQPARHPMFGTHMVELHTTEARPGKRVRMAEEEESRTTGPGSSGGGDRGKGKKKKGADEDDDDDDE